MKKAVEEYKTPAQWEIDTLKMQLESAKGLLAMADKHHEEMIKLFQVIAADQKNEHEALLRKVGMYLDLDKKVSELQSFLVKNQKVLCQGK